MDVNIPSVVCGRCWFVCCIYRVVLPHLNKCTGIDLKNGL